MIFDLALGIDQFIILGQLVGVMLHGLSVRHLCRKSCISTQIKVLLLHYQRESIIHLLD